jgi:hypothetical protein
METTADTLKTLERKFWQSLVDQDADAALDLLADRALMVSAHGAMTFDHEGYRRMAEKGSQVLSAFEMENVQVLMPTDSTAILTYDVKQTVSPRGQEGGEVQHVHDTSTWVRTGGQWKCVAHTETPAGRPGNPTRSNA